MGVWILILGFRRLTTEETQCTDKSDAILYGSVVPKRVETVLIKKLCTYRIMICRFCYCRYCCILTQSWCCDFVPFYPVQTSFSCLVLASPPLSRSISFKCHERCFRVEHFCSKSLPWDQIASASFFSHFAPPLANSKLKWCEVTFLV